MRIAVPNVGLSNGGCGNEAENQCACSEPSMHHMYARGLMLQGAVIPIRNSASSTTLKSPASLQGELSPANNSSTPKTALRRSRTMKAILLAILAAVIAQSASAAKIKANYRCDDGTRLVASFKTPSSGLGSVALKYVSSGKKVVLPQKVSADGGRYASSGMQFWVKGQTATFTTHSRNTVCRTKS
jgi:membrane-bound inhibitor of C-type lysozyme